MTIIKNLNTYKSDFLVPDHSSTVNHDITAFLGYSVVNQGSKLPIAFDYDKGEKLLNCNTFANATLTKAEIDPNWTNNSSVKPIGAYIATQLSANTVVKAPTRDGLKTKYLYPLIDSWTRQKNRPNIIDYQDLATVSSTADNFNVILKSRGYQTNDFAYLDLMPLAFEYLHLNKITEYRLLIDNIANCLTMPAKNKENKQLQLSSVFQQAMTPLIFKIATGFYFRSLLDQLEDGNNFKDLQKQATLIKTIEFFTKKLMKTTYTFEQVKNLLNKYHLSYDHFEKSDQITLFEVLVNLIDFTGSNNKFEAIQRNNISMLKQLYHSSQTLSAYLTISCEYLIDFLNALSLVSLSKLHCTNFTPDIISNCLGKALCLKIKKSMLTNNLNYQMKITDGLHSYQINCSQNLWVIISLKDLNLAQPLTIQVTTADPTKDTVLAQGTINLSVSDHQYPDFIIDHIEHLDSRPFALFASPVPNTEKQVKQYSSSIIKVLYTAMSDLVYQNTTDQKLCHPVKEVCFMFDQDNLDNNAANTIMLATSLGIGWQNTLVVCNSSWSSSAKEIIKANCSIYIDLIDHKFNAKIDDKEPYSEYRYLPCWTNSSLIILETNNQARLKQIMQDMKYDTTKNRLERLIKILLKQESENNHAVSN